MKQNVAGVKSLVCVWRKNKKNMRECDSIIMVTSKVSTKFLAQIMSADCIIVLHPLFEFLCIYTFLKIIHT